MIDIQFFSLLNHRGSYCKLTGTVCDGGVAFPIDGDNFKLHCKLEFNSYSPAALNFC